MKWIFFLLACVFSLSPLSAQLSAERPRGSMPEFSWDTLPLYMHVRKRTAFSEEELKFLQKFPLITLEKSNGHETYGSVDAGSIEAAKAIKKHNRSAKVLFYRNVLCHYGNYSFDDQLNSIPDWYLVGRNGEDKLVRGRVRAYDLSNKDVVDWWVDTMAEVCNDPYIDGLFLDGNIKVLSSYQDRVWMPGKKEAVIKGYHKMMRDARRALRPEKLMVANIIRARLDDAGLEYLNYFDGSYLEGFEHAVGGMSQAEYMAKGIRAIQEAAQGGKIIALTLGIGETGLGDGIDESKSAISDIAAVSQARVDFCIALFLIVAEKYSYLMLSDGYGVDPRGGNSSESKLWLNTFPEYERPLGRPKGPALVLENYRYIRYFEHVTVGLDLLEMRGHLIWK